VVPRPIESCSFFRIAKRALYLMLIVLGIFGKAVRDRLIVSGDAAATAANITSMESLWRFGIASESSR
jgi:hypothetical protein